jgi:dehydrogenase/reductase SDR family protein 12
MFYDIERFQSHLHTTMLQSLLDTILDRTVVAGYTRVGYHMRRGTWSPAELQSMDGKVVLVTGATSGLGLAAAEGFARLGAAVRLLARSAERGERARASVAERSPNSDVQVSLCRCRAGAQLGRLLA